MILRVGNHRGGPPKWMVKIIENPIKMDDLGVPLFFKRSYLSRPEICVSKVKDHRLQVTKKIEV